MRASLVAPVAGFALLLTGCGGASASFPEEAECVAPAPLATSRAAPGTVSPEAYVRRLQSFASNLEQLRADLRRTYPEDTFYRRDDFRPDFAEYASKTVCTAQAMVDLAPPDQRYAAFDEALDLLLKDLIDHTRAGREAVRSRNVSEYRDWHAGADERITAVRVAAYGVSSRP